VSKARGGGHPHPFGSRRWWPDQESLGPTHLAQELLSERGSLDQAPKPRSRVVKRPTRANDSTDSPEPRCMHAQVARDGATATKYSLD
jgi:hypothetical protein